MTQLTTDAWSVAAIAFSAVFSHALLSPLWAHDPDPFEHIRDAPPVVMTIPWERADRCDVMLSPSRPGSDVRFAPNVRPNVVRFNRQRWEGRIEGAPDLGALRDGPEPRESVERGHDHDHRWDRKRRKRRRPRR